jgi:hypothetical protein
MGFPWQGEGYGARGGKKFYVVDPGDGTKQDGPLSQPLRGAVIGDPVRTAGKNVETGKAVTRKDSRDLIERKDQTTYGFKDVKFQAVDLA